MINKDMRTHPIDAEEQYHLGWRYENGRGVTQDYDQAFQWYTKAAEQGSPDAQYNLGWMYSRGRGVTRDHKQAVKWFTKSAEQDALGM